MKTLLTVALVLCLALGLWITWNKVCHSLRPDLIGTHYDRATVIYTSGTEIEVDKNDLKKLVSAINDCPRDRLTDTSVPAPDGRIVFSTETDHIEVGFNESLNGELVILYSGNSVTTHFKLP